jgi:hypothetical protein
MSTNRDRHAAIIREFRKTVNRKLPGSAGAAPSVCANCPDLENCRNALHTGRLFPCQPQEQDKSIYASARIPGDFDGMLTDKPAGVYHKPAKRKVITTEN